MEKEHLEILLEDIRGKFDLVLEGHDTLRKEIRDTREELGEKINLVDFKVETLNQKIDGVRDGLNQKIDAVAADLTAHRADTESHKTGYRVSESRE
jgi:archaellum component FlaC